MSYKKRLPALMAAGMLALLGGTAYASSHSDAPLIVQDPPANLTDVYAFIGDNKAGVKVLNVVVNVHPFVEPGNGVIYDRFADDALYSIHITNPTTGDTALRYNFQFSPVTSGYKNLNTILSYGLGTEVGPIMDVGDARQNYVQTYTVTKVVGQTASVINGDKTLLCPPPNVGKNTTPFYNDPTTGFAESGATTYDALDKYTKETVYNLSSGNTVFAGEREDSFFADVPGIFDLLDARILKTDQKGVDGFKGFNVLTYAIQIPVSQLAGVIPGYPEVGVYATVSRQRVTLRQMDARPESSGPWIQVNRLGNPLFNEVLVALKDKDNYNRDLPKNDAAKYSKYAFTPEVAHLINFKFGTHFQETARADLAQIYIPDVIRVDTSTPPVPLDMQPGFSRLSLFGGDFIMDAAGKSVPSGWPNGRRFGDDVIDIALTAIANGPNYTPPIMPLGDNVDSNDQVYNQVFPYAATPHSGAMNRKDPAS